MNHQPGGSDSSDDDWGSGEPPVVASWKNHHYYDPELQPQQPQQEQNLPQATIERNERIHAMLQAGAVSGCSDDDVTDFILHMQQKNNRMMEHAATSDTQEEDEEDYYSSSDEEHHHQNYEGGEELDASFSNNNKMARRRKLKDEYPEDYPPGEAYDYAGDEEEIPGYDPKEDDLLPKSRLCCIACVLLISMVAMSMFILLLIVVLADEESASKKSKFGFVIPPAPSQLSQMCSPESLQTTNGRMECREPCREAACCWETGESGLEPICWDENPLECAPYQICINILRGGQGSSYTVENDPQKPNEEEGQGKPRPMDTDLYVQPAPQGIASCDPAIVSTSVDELLLCEDSCSHAPCCWKEGSKTCADHPNCGTYSSCSILNAKAAAGQHLQQQQGEHLPAPVSDIAELCSAPKSQLQMCAHYCNLAECCWKTATSSTTNPDGSVTAQAIAGSCSDKPACDHYMPCTVLNDEDVSSGAVDIPDAPEGLDFTCRTSPEECQEACNLATCCWKTSTVTSTNGGLSLSENVAGICASEPECKDYEPCYVLQHGITDAISIPQPPPNLAQVCNSDPSMCQRYCKEAPCCWEYVTVTSTNVETGASSTAVTEGACSSQPSCEAYRPCEVLQGSGSSSIASGSNNTSIPPPPSNLESICNPSDPNADGAFDECESECSQATCCWKTTTTEFQTPEGQTVEESVAGECASQQICIQYSPCSVLEDDLFSPGTDTTSSPTSSPATTSDNAEQELTAAILYDACYNHIDQPGVVESLCEKECKSGSCCYTRGETCDATIDCVKYQPCHKLVEDDSTNTSVRSHVDEACANAADLADCVELCGASACCFTEAIEKSCEEKGIDIVCGDYDGCKTLYK